MPPSIYQGIAFDGIRLEFKSGKIVDATSNETNKLNKMLDSDPGARYIGEFSLGFNPRIRHPMRDILFDEKIAGSFHFTPRPSLRGSGQWKPKPGALGHGKHPASRIRRRRNLFRRRADSKERGVSPKPTAFAKLALNCRPVFFLRRRFVSSDSLWRADRVQMHHANFAAFAELQIYYFKHWRAFSWGRPGARQLNSHLLGIRV
jgi:hypothetical protein